MTWVEKHRPKKFEEIKGQDIALVNIKKFLEDEAESDEWNATLKQRIILKQLAQQL